MGKVVLLLWIATIVFGVFWFGYYQEGHNQDVTIEMESKGGQASSGKTYLTRDIFAVFDEKGSKKLLGIIVDTKEETLTVINYEKKTYATEAISFASDLNCKRALVSTPLLTEELTRLPDHKMIAGYRCHAFESETPGVGKVTTWYAYDFPTGRVKTALWNKLARAEAKGQAAQIVLALVKGQAGGQPVICSSYEYFPAPLALDMRGTHAIAKRITFGKVDTSEFDVPSGFEKKSFEEVLIQQQPARRTR